MLKPVLIPPDCPSHEAPQLISASLLQVYKALDETFNKLEAKLDKCHEKSLGITQRIDVIDKKVKALSKADNAVLIHRSRYPDIRSNHLNAIFENEDFVSPSLKANLLFTDEPISNQVLKDAISRKKDFGYAFSKGKHLETLKRMNFKDDLEDGFCELLDEEFLFSEKGKIVRSKDKFDSEAESLLIYDSIGKGFDTDPLAYKPGLGSLNTFNFPDVLPDLIGVSSTPMFSDQEFQPIAPSLIHETTKKESALPTSLTTTAEIYTQSSKNVEQETSVKVEKAPTPELPETLTVPSSASPPTIVSVPPPPPVIASPLIPASSQLPSTSAIPPPPPPPPPLLSPALPQLPDLSKGHMDLLQAIRDAGGAQKAKLKSVATIEKGSPIASASKSKPILGAGDGEDLMSTLKQQLEKRRKVMAGGTKNRAIQKLENKKVKPESNDFSRLRDTVPMLPDDGNKSEGGEGWE